MKFTASAPGKAILFGEHYVVYGSPALSVAIEPRSLVEFSEAEHGILLKSSLGNGKIPETGEFSGSEELRCFSEVAKKIGGKIISCTASFKPGWKLKGAGTSASLCAAFAAGLFHLLGKQPSAEELFEAAQAGDMVAHKGKASGIDAKTVCLGAPLVFTRSFDPPGFIGKKTGFCLPKQTVLLLIDTFEGKKDSTGKMVEKFAQEFDIVGKPQSAAKEKREQITKEYAPVWEKLNKAIKSADAKALGSVMNENHALLKNRGMSSEGIEKAVSAALSLGAYGAKLTGGGGEGGAVLVLCRKNDKEKVCTGIGSQTSFACHEILLANKGACVQ